jgi:hypothetical protein
MVQASRVWTTYVMLPVSTYVRRRRVVGYSLMVQASRVSVFFVMLAAVVRIYSALTNGAGITRLNNIRAAAGQHLRSTTARRRVLTNGAGIAPFRHFRYACSSSTDI